MKNEILFLLLLTFLINAPFGFGKIDFEIPFYKNESIYEHLKEVNVQWQFQKELPSFFQKKNSFQNDIQRIQKHLLLVHYFLKIKDTSHLPFSQRKNRNKFLRILHQYALEGVFPQNIYHEKRTPYFIDHRGVMCAVGFLMYKSGAKDLVDIIHLENNYKYIFELQRLYPQVNDWANENGFTMDELAWIQPTYCGKEFFYGLGNGGGPDKNINVLKVNPDSSLLLIGGDFSSMDGISAGGIIGWDGIQWVTFDNGVNGEVNSIAYHNDQLFIGGNFKLHGEDDFTNVAFWSGDDWVGWKMESEGKVLALQSYHGRLHAGGDFQLVNGDTMLNLAYYDESEEKWSNNGLAYLNGEVVAQPGMFAVDGVVKSFMVWNDLLYVGGSFRKTSPNVTNPNVMQFDVKSLAIWYDYLWIDEEEVMNQIIAMDTLDGDLILIGKTEDKETIISSNQNGNWESLVVSFPNEDAILHGVVTHDETTFLYGSPIGLGDAIVNLYYSLWWFIFDISTFPCESFNNTVSSGVYFKGNYYFAGDFTAVEFLNDPTEYFNKIVFSKMDRTWQHVIVKNETPNFTSSQIKIHNANRTIYVAYENLKTDVELLIFNLNGQQLKTINLEKGNQEYSFEMYDLPSGYYFYQIKNQNFQQAGKFSFY